MSYLFHLFTGRQFCPQAPLAVGRPFASHAMFKRDSQKRLRVACLVIVGANVGTVLGSAMVLIDTTANLPTSENPLQTAQFTLLIQVTEDVCVPAQG